MEKEEIINDRFYIMEEFLSLQFRGIPDSVFIVSFLILSILIVLMFMLRRNHRTTRKSVFLMLLVEYVFLMFCSTVICRDSHPETTRLELMPFWNYHDVLLSGKPMHYWEVILNVVLYSPIGFLLGGICKRVSSTIMICVFLSVATEGLQLLLHRGLCETDDVIHNTLGGFIGYFSYVGVVKGVRKYQIRLNNQ